MKSLWLCLVITLSGCSLLGALGDPANLIKNVAVTGVTYAVGGIIPAVAVGATALTVDKVFPHDTTPQIQEIETEVLMRAFIIANLTDNILYGAIAALLIFMIVVPWATQRRARRKMKYDQIKAELTARRLKDAS